MSPSEFTWHITRIRTISAFSTSTEEKKKGVT